MRRLIPLSFVASLVILAGLTTGLSLAQSGASTSAKMVLSCSNKLGARPATYVLSCADANSMLASLRWSDWGDATAFATGKARWNDCTPTCVAGTWKEKAVTVWAWRLRGGLYTRLSSNDPALVATITPAPYPG